MGVIEPVKWPCGCMGETLEEYNKNGCAEHGKPRPAPVMWGCRHCGLDSNTGRACAQCGLWKDYDYSTFPGRPLTPEEIAGLEDFKTAIRRKNEEREQRRIAARTRAISWERYMQENDPPLPLTPKDFSDAEGAEELNARITKLEELALPHADRNAFHDRLERLEAVAHAPLGQDAIYERLERLESITLMDIGY